MKKTSTLIFLLLFINLAYGTEVCEPGESGVKAIFLGTTPAVIIPSHCQPDAPESLNVYEDVNTSSREIYWQVNPSHTLDTWGVSYFKISARSGNEVIDTIIVDVNEQRKISTNSLTADNYFIQACSRHECSAPTYRWGTNGFEQGLTRPVDAVGLWNTDDPNNLSYRFRFKYPDYAFNSTFGEPEKFIIEPIFEQPSAVQPIEVFRNPTPQNGNCNDLIPGIPCDGDLRLWYSDEIPRSWAIGRDFSIKACRQDLGCGPHLNVRLDNPVTSETMPVPQWNNTQLEVVNYGTDFLLQWDGSIFSNEDVDYLEIQEEQPVRDAGSLITDGPSSQIITYYIDKGYHLKLNRMVKGLYVFKAKACKRNRVQGDVCSNYSQSKPVDLNRQEINFSLVNPPSLIGRVLLTDGVTESSTVAWNEASYTPDYYWAEITTGGDLDSCNISFTTVQRYIERTDVHRTWVDLSGLPDSNMYTINEICPEIEEMEVVRIRSCFNGVGCSANYASYEYNLDDAVIGTGQLSTRSSTRLNGSTVGGPGDMKPGVWWNPQMSGTGWHFYWASELRYPSVHENYGNTYDLIGVWLTYQEINGVWSPTWLMSHLKAVDDIDPNIECPNGGFDCQNYFEGDLTYVTRPGQNLERENIGSIKVFFDQSTNPDDNVSVMLKMDVDSENGLFTLPGSLVQDNGNCDVSGTPVNDCLKIDINGNLDIPLSNFAETIAGNPIVGAYDNDIDHYSGLWSHVNPNLTINNEFSYMVDIQKNLEWSSILFYDNAGVPVWAQSDTCDGNPQCRKTDDGVEGATYKTIKQGFNPLFYTPIGWWDIEENLVEVGAWADNSRRFRSSNVPEFTQMEMWVDLDTGNHLSGRRGILKKGNFTDPAKLIKSASFHDIRFFINGSDENRTICDPNTEFNGRCDITFKWFTDDDFRNIKPFYRKDNGAVTPLEDLCGLPVQTDHYVETEYLCNISQPGDYVFELRKPSYLFPEAFIEIADSKVLEIYPCNTDECLANTYTPLPNVTTSEDSFIGPDSETGNSGNGDGDGLLEWSDLPDAPTTSEEVGASQGAFNVTSGGAAGYSIPIKTAPASGGQQPQMSISYNSQGGRGPLGMGWSVSGYSVVSRCAQTFEQDYDESSSEPLIQSVTFNDTDRFCVDGQRLMLVTNTGHDYGDNGAEYRTEINNFTKYFSKGSSNGSGPQCFEAWHKDGSKTFYGNCDVASFDDSSFAKSGIDNVAMMWAQSKSVDDKGNYYINQYHSNVIASDTFNKTVEFHLDEVIYSKHETESTENGSIKLVYQNMPSTKVTGDIVVSNYMADPSANTNWRRQTIKVLKNNKKLIRIDSKFGDEFIRSYKLHYNQTDTAGIDVLTAVEECASSDSDSSCLEETTFEWGNDASNNIMTTSTSPFLNLGDIQDNEYAVTSLDANGDGHTDFYVTGGIDKVYLNNPDTGTYSELATLALSRDFGIADINADGFPDFTDDEKIYLWNGSGYEAPISINEHGYDIKNYTDMNGDGLVDAIGVRHEYDSVNDIEYLYIGIFTNRYDLTFGEPGGMAANIKAAFGEPVDIVIDFDSNSFLQEYESPFVSGMFYNDYLPEISKIISIYDANNDGVSELLVQFEKDDWCLGDQGKDCYDPHVETAFTSGYAELHLDQGVGNTYVPEFIGGGSDCEACDVKITPPSVLDINGDGKLEKCYVESYPRGGPVGTANGSHICKGANIVNNSAFFERIRLNNNVDLNGDGFMDLLNSSGYDRNSKWRVNYSKWNNGRLTYSDNWVDTNFSSGNATGNPNANTDLRFMDKSLFLDFNNDQITDHLLFKVDASDNSLKVYKSLGVNSQGEIHSKDKITKFNNGLGKSNEVIYDSMANTDIYTREVDSYIMWFGQSRAPVYDYVSSMPLVASVEMTMPAWFINNSELNGSAVALPNNTQKTSYHYKNAKLQAGGRGFLGFGEFSVFDEQNRILTQSLRRQDFPYTGFTYKTQTWQVPLNTNRLAVNTTVKDLSTPCWVNNSCGESMPAKNPCITDRGFYCPVGFESSIVSRGVNTSGATLLSSTEVVWDEAQPHNTSGRSRFVFKDKVYKDTYELNGGAQLGSIFTNYTHNHEFGFIENIIENAYQGSDSGEDWVQQKGTYQTIDEGFQQDQWIVNRINSETTIHQRPGKTNEHRYITRTFDDDALLKTETYRGSGSVARVRTIISRNAFGMIEHEKLTAADAVTTEKKTFYDPYSRVLIKTQNKIGGSFQTTDEVLQFNQLGQPEISRNAQGVKTFMKYDDMGKLFYTIDETGAFNEVNYHWGSGNYCGSGTVYHTTSFSLDGNVSISPKVWSCFDQLGRNIRTVTQGFNANQRIFVDQQFDNSGRLIAISTPQFSSPSVSNSNHWTRMAHDEIGREIFRREPFSATSSQGPQAHTTETFYKYDGARELLKMKVTNAHGHKTRTFTNILGEVKEVVNAEDDAVYYDYDARGNQTSVDGPLAGDVDEVVTSYDNFDNISNIDDPNLGFWRYKYNAMGQLVHQRDAKGNCTKIYYDELGRITDKYFYLNTSTSCTGGSLEDHHEFSFDNSYGDSSFGQLVLERSNASEKTYSYDEFGRVDTVTSTLRSHSMTRFEEFFYDAYGRVKAFYDASGHGSFNQFNAQGYQYATQGQRTGVSYQTILDRNAFGHITKEVSGNGIYTNRDYDVAGRMKLLISGTADGASDIQFMNYEFDAVGNMVKRTDSRFVGTELFGSSFTAEEVIDEFTYDKVNRLTRADITYVDSVAGEVELIDYDITYDSAGRRETLNHQGNSITYSYDPNHIHGVSSTSDGKSYDYDAVGSQTVSDYRTLEYTSFNKVKHIRNTNAYHQVDYTYDTSNQKITRIDTENGEEKLTWYVGNVEVITSDWEGGAPGEIKLKRYVGENAVVTHHGPDIIDIEYMHKDHLGSIQAFTKQGVLYQGNSLPVYHLSWDAFGKGRGKTTPSTKFTFLLTDSITNKGFTGQDHISELGLINFNARLYDSKLGMMLQADTIIPDGPVADSLNRYAYVFNNPLSYVDPTGHNPELWDPWVDMRKENNTNIPANVTRDNTGTGGKSGVSQRSRPKPRNNTSTQHETPEGVTDGSMGNGDLANPALSFGYTGEVKYSSNGGRKTGEGWNITPHGVFDSSGNRKSLEDMGVDSSGSMSLWDVGKEVIGLFDPSQAVRGCYSAGCGIGGWGLAIAETVPLIKWFRRGGAVITRGGKHGDVKGIPGNESHHMPADSVSPLSTHKGPAVSMEKADHRQTASWGSSRKAKNYRSQQKQMIDAGDFRGAQQMDIDDIRKTFGGKYDSAIEEMLFYTDQINL